MLSMDAAKNWRRWIAPDGAAACADLQSEVAEAGGSDQPAGRRPGGLVRCLPGPLRGRSGRSVPTAVSARVMGDVARPRGRRGRPRMMARGRGGRMAFERRFTSCRAEFQTAMASRAARLGDEKALARLPVCRALRARCRLVGRRALVDARRRGLPSGGDRSAADEDSSVAGSIRAKAQSR